MQDNCRNHFLGQPLGHCDHYDAEVGIKFGSAEFLGTNLEQRDGARKIYETNIRESKVAEHN